SSAATKSGRSTARSMRWPRGSRACRTQASWGGSRRRRWRRTVRDWLHAVARLLQLLQPARHVERFLPARLRELVGRVELEDLVPFLDRGIEVLAAECRLRVPVVALDLFPLGDLLLAGSNRLGGLLDRGFRCRRLGGLRREGRGGLCRRGPRGRERHFPRNADHLPGAELLRYLDVVVASKQPELATIAKRPARDAPERFTPAHRVGMRLAAERGRRIGRDSLHQAGRLLVVRVELAGLPQLRARFLLVAVVQRFERLAQ